MRSMVGEFPLAVGAFTLPYLPPIIHQKYPHCKEFFLFLVDILLKEEYNQYVRIGHC